MNRLDIWNYELYHAPDGSYVLYRGRFREDTTPESQYKVINKELYKELFKHYDLLNMIQFDVECEKAWNKL